MISGHLLWILCKTSAISELLWCLNSTDNAIAEAMQHKISVPGNILEIWRNVTLTPDTINSDWMNVIGDFSVFCCLWRLFATSFLFSLFVLRWFFYSAVRGFPPQCLVFVLLRMGFRARDKSTQKIFFIPIVDPETKKIILIMIVYYFVNWKISKFDLPLLYYL